MPPLPHRSGGIPAGARGQRHEAKDWGPEQERKPKREGKAGAERAEGEIKGCVFLGLKSLDRLGVSLDTTAWVYPRNRVSAGRAYSFFVAVSADA